MNYILRLENQATESLLGGKAKALGQLEKAGFLIPKGFVVSSAAWEFSLTTEQLSGWKSIQDESEIAALLLKLQRLHQNFPQIQLHPLILQELQQALAELSPSGELVAVRSSAVEEDGLQYSFAGQLESFLNVSLEEVAEKITLVWRSRFSERVLMYCRERGLSLIPQPPAVLIQRMVYPQVAGVAFGVEPVTGTQGIAVVSAVSGNGASLVSGESDADSYYVDRAGKIIKCQIVDQPVLDDGQVQAVAGCVRQAGRYFHRPQDIEWAIANGQLYLLQSRPITTLGQIAQPDGVLNLWDNSNIAESYSGVTQPLTFSFARKAYEEVYRQFCHFMGVPPAKIAQHHDTFARMIGLIRGRVFYNLLSWYKVLALLPGFTVNRRFMEQMMGVKESLPDSIIAELQAATWQNRLQDSWYLCKTVVGLISNYFLLPVRIQQFYTRINQALSLPSLNLEHWRADELATYYRQIEGKLLTHWDAPLINDFFAMIFYGLLRSLTAKWCGDELGSLQNDLIGLEGGVISAEPAKRMQKMANLASENPEFAKLLCQGSLDAILQVMETIPQFQLEYQEYIEKFGDRCLDELKLESPTLHDQPLLLLRGIGQLIQMGVIYRNKPIISFRQAAEQKAHQALRANPLRKLIFNWVLNNARKRVQSRENLRFERTRVFGRARRVFVELGRRFYALDLLISPADIFYLEVNEILMFIEGTTTCTNLKGLVALRKAEFAEYYLQTPPSSRFATRGIVHQGNSFQQENLTAKQEELSQQKQGIACSPGVVRGHVRVIFDPQEVLTNDNNNLLTSGTILVAERTDPGWILLFPSAAGLLVERGSLLSHAAIVARELGIPAIVSISGVTQWLKDGDLVEMDGSTGKITRLQGFSGT
ncbi:MAG: PEP/pyruvate-binding domain-containing protein [Gloeotrichia echinulata IR180]|jgi:phosphohistidine swiveling domain-containing protein